MAVPKQTDPQFKLRLTPELKVSIEKAADESGRSMNAEIIHRLEASFAADRTDLDLSNPANQLAIVQAVKVAIEDTMRAIDSASITLYGDVKKPRK